MKNYRKLKIGEIVKPTDEIKRRNQWLPATDFGTTVENAVHECMKPVRRKMTIEQIDSDFEIYDGKTFIATTGSKQMAAKLVELIIFLAN